MPLFIAYYWKNSDSAEINTLKEFQSETSLNDQIFFLPLMMYV